MKKRLLVLGLAFTMLAATACGTSSDDGNKTSKADKTVTATSNSDKTSETQKNDDKKDDAKESYKSADDITMDDLKNHEETPAEDFKYRDKSNGEAVIKEYTGDDPIVVIPNEIDGKKVMDFGKTFTNNKDIVAIKIGDNILVGPGTCITSETYDSWVEIDDEKSKVYKSISIGENVWIEANVTIFGGVTIGKNSVIGAGAVVTQDIPEGVIAYGVPCTVKKADEGT